MPSQVSISQRCLLLKQKREQLLVSVSEQQQLHRDLLLRHNLLQAWCECLSLIQVNKMQQECGTWTASSSSDDGPVQEFERLLEAEVTLLNQLSPSPSLGSLAATPLVLDVGVDTIAPISDPMAYFKQHISTPPRANAAAMSQQDMAELMRESSLQLSVQLHILQNSPPDRHPEAKARLRAALDKVVHAAISLVMVGKEDVVEAANFCNLQTLQPDTEGATQQAALTTSLIDHLDMTPAQQHVIATGSAMYLHVLQSVMQERQLLQSQFAAPESRQGSTVSGNADGACDGGSGDRDNSSSGRGGVVDAAASSSSAPLEELFRRRQQQLEAQQKQAARLQLLIRKEMMLRMAGMTWFIGCLSEQQIGKACVMCWPYTLRPSLLAQEIQRRAEQAAGSSAMRPPGQQQQQRRQSGPQ